MSEMEVSLQGEIHFVENGRSGVSLAGSGVRWVGRWAGGGGVRITRIPNEIGDRSRLALGSETVAGHSSRKQEEIAEQERQL